MSRNRNPKGSDGQFWESKLTNERTYQLYYERIMGLAISRFKWNGLPETIDERFLEMILFTDGMACFFKDEVLGYLGLQCMINGRLDVYRNPINIRAYATNNFQKELNQSNSVVIYNNVLRNNSMMPAEQYAMRMYEIERTIDVNVKAQKTPVLVLGSEDQRLTLLNLYMKYDGNEPFIFGDRNNMDLGKMSVLKTDAPFVAKDLQVLKGDIWNECLTYFGIGNVNSDKKERLITSEVEKTNNPVKAQQEIWLNTRRQACEKINKMFGLNVSVEFNDDIDTSLGGESNGIYNQSSNDSGE